LVLSPARNYKEILIPKLNKKADGAFGEPCVKLESKKTVNVSMKYGMSKENPCMN